MSYLYHRDQERVRQAIAPASLNVDLDWSLLSEQTGIPIQRLMVRLRSFALDGVLVRWYPLTGRYRRRCYDA